MQACLSTLEPTMWLGDSRLLFEPRANIELDQLSVMELMQTLHSRGWAAIQQVEQGRGRLSKSKIHDGSLQEWYYRHRKAPLRLYMLALVKAGDFLEPVGCLKYIAHNKAGVHYQQILEGRDPDQVKRQNQLQLTDDCGDDMVIPISSAAPSLLDIASSGRGRGKCRGTGQGKSRGRG